jgi:hypothetical protein
MGVVKRNTGEVQILDSLAAMRVASGAAVWAAEGWWAGEVLLAHAVVRRLLSADLVEPVRRNRDGLAVRVELNLRGQDALAGRGAP